MNERHFCGCGTELEHWKNAGTYYCPNCDVEYKRSPDGKWVVIS